MMGQTKRTATAYLGWGRFWRRVPHLHDWQPSLVQHGITVAVACTRCGKYREMV